MFLTTAGDKAAMANASPVITHHFGQLLGIFLRTIMYAHVMEFGGRPRPAAMDSRINVPMHPVDCSA